MTNHQTIQRAICDNAKSDTEWQECTPEEDAYYAELEAQEEAREEVAPWDEPQAWRRAYTC
jgi:hypothetical protein